MPKLKMVKKLYNTQKIKYYFPLKDVSNRSGGLQ